MVGRKDKKLEMHSTTALVVMKKHPRIVLKQLQL